MAIVAPARPTGTCWRRCVFVALAPPDWHLLAAKTIPFRFANTVTIAGAGGVVALISNRCGSRRVALPPRPSRGAHRVGGWHAGFGALLAILSDIVESVLWCASLAYDHPQRQRHSHHSLAAEVCSWESVRWTTLRRAEYGSFSRTGFFGRVRRCEISHIIKSGSYLLVTASIRWLPRVPDSPPGRKPGALWSWSSGCIYRSLWLREVDIPVMKTNRDRSSR